MFPLIFLNLCAHKISLVQHFTTINVAVLGTPPHISSVRSVLPQSAHSSTLPNYVATRGRTSSSSSPRCRPSSPRSLAIIPSSPHIIFTHRPHVSTQGLG